MTNHALAFATRIDSSISALKSFEPFTMIVRTIARRGQHQNQNPGLPRPSGCPHAVISENLIGAQPRYGLGIEGVPPSRKIPHLGRGRGVWTAICLSLGQLPPSPQKVKHMLPYVVLLLHQCNTPGTKHHRLCCALVCPGFQANLGLC